MYTYVKLTHPMCSESSRGVAILSECAAVRIVLLLITEGHLVKVFCVQPLNSVLPRQQFYLRVVFHHCDTWLLVLFRSLSVNPSTRNLT